MMSKGGSKSLLMAYICWLIGGLFGLHHFYLGRDKHAFITFCTFGGYFTMGLWRDLWRLPEYVKDANNDVEYLQWLHKQVKQYSKPPSSIVRQSGLMLMGNLFAYLIEYAIPKELFEENNLDFLLLILRFLLIPFASAFGVWLAGNVGRHKGCLSKPLVAAYIAAIPSILLDIPHASFSTLAAVIIFNKYCKDWNLERKPKKPLVKRLLAFTFCVLIYLSLWTSWLYFGCTIEDPESLEPIKCRVAMANFFNGPAWTNLSEAIWLLVEHTRNQGFIGLWREIMQEFDFSGKGSALATLELSESASHEEIIAQYKKLSRLYHPDREKNPEKKQEMQEKFIQVQEAYRKLEASVKRYKLQKQRDDEQRNTRDEL